MIWTKLTRTDAVFSRATSVVFCCAGFWIFRYAGKIPKTYIKNQRSGLPENPKGGHRVAGGQPGGCLVRPSPWPRHLPSWLGPTPPGALLWPYLFSRRKNPRTEVTFPIYVAEPPQPSVLPRRANLEAELASDEGESSPSSSSSPLHHPSMTSSLMCE